MGEERKNSQSRGKEMSLTGLFGQDKFEILQKRLAAATDFSFSTIDFKGSEVFPGFYQDYYKNYLRQHKGNVSCKMSAAFGAAKAAITNLPYIYLCDCGLVKIAVPIVVNEQYLGAVICGYICCRDLDYLDPETNLHIVNTDLKKNDTDVSEHLDDFPVFSAQKIKACADLIFYVVQEICQKENISIRISNEEHTQIHLSDMRRKNRELKEKLLEYEQKDLNANLYPQTLLNMLVTISNMAILEDSPTTQELVETFSSILRYYVEYEKEYISLDREMQQIEKYMKVVKLRYDDRVKFEINAPDRIKRQTLPKLILLPLVEYTMFNNVVNGDFKGTVRLDTEFISGRCIVRILMDKDKTSRTHTENGQIMDEQSYHMQIDKVRKRLDIEYSDDYKLLLEENEIVLDIPHTAKNV